MRHYTPDVLLEGIIPPKTLLALYQIETEFSRLILRIFNLFFRTGVLAECV